MKPGKKPKPTRKGSANRSFGESELARLQNTIADQKHLDLLWKHHPDKKRPHKGDKDA